MSQISPSRNTPESLILTSFDRQSHLHLLLAENVKKLHRKPIKCLPSLPALKLPDGQSIEGHRVQINEPNFQIREIENLQLEDLHS